jgi:hypothetical protein
VGVLGVGGGIVLLTLVAALLLRAHLKRTAVISALFLAALSGYYFFMVYQTMHRH